MPYYRGTLLFNYTGSPNAGFSESAEFSATDDNTAKAKIAMWPAQRKKWLAQQWKIVGFRLAKITLASSGGKCKKKYEPVQIGACAGEPAGDLGDADSPYTGVLFAIDMFGAPKPRQYIARGVPDTWWTGGALTIPAADGNKFLAWFNWMKTTGGAGSLKGSGTGCDPTLRNWLSYCKKRIASHRVGRPFGLLRGRRGKKKVT